MNENCFCHFNGYEVKDAKARAGIESLNEKIETRTIVFNSVSDMKQSTDLTNSNVVITKGFYNANDDGNAIYNIRTKTASDIVDEMFIISIGSELVAELIHDEYINPKQIGGYGDGIHDDFQVLQSAINKGNVLLVKGNYLVSDTINVPSNRIFDGGNNTIIPAQGKYALKLVGTGINDSIRQTYVKNLFINCNSGGNGIHLENGYFNYFDNINIDRLSKDNAIGFNILNGFNHKITNSRVLGNIDYTGQIGININSSNTINDGIENMTNCSYDTILLQRLEYGVKANWITSANMIDFNNLGFSDDKYSFHLAGYGKPVAIRNTRIETGERQSKGEELTGFYFSRSIDANIDTFNAFNINKVIDNANTEAGIIINGNCVCNGTTQSSKFKVIANTQSSIINNANWFMDSNTYYLTGGATFNGGTLTNISKNSNVSEISAERVDIETTYNKTYKITGTKLLNIYGCKGSECYLYTENEGVELSGNSWSSTNKWPSTIVMEPYKLYRIKMIDNNQCIISA